jgi:hypothetical protein
MAAQSAGTPAPRDGCVEATAAWTNYAVYGRRLWRWPVFAAGFSQRSCRAMLRSRQSLGLAPAPAPDFKGLGQRRKSTLTVHRVRP